MKLTIVILMLLIALCQNNNQVDSLHTCQQSVVSSLVNLKKTMNGTQNSIIDGVADFAKNVSHILRGCSLSKYADQFDHECPAVCIDDLEKGAKILLKINNQTDNQAKFAFDFLVLQKLYQNKIKKECLFLNKTNFEVNAGGVCLQSAYQLSLVVQTLWEHLGQGNLKAALADFDIFITNLPDTLEKCGESAWANQVRKYFPLQCLYSINDLAKQLSVFEHNYDHLEWLVKHWKDLSKAFGYVKKTCPFFA